MWPDRAARREPRGPRRRRTRARHFVNRSRHVHMRGIEKPFLAAVTAAFASLTVTPRGGGRGENESNAAGDTDAGATRGGWIEGLTRDLRSKGAIRCDGIDRPQNENEDRGRGRGARFARRRVFGDCCFSRKNLKIAGNDKKWMFPHLHSHDAGSSHFKIVCVLSHSF